MEINSLKNPFCLLYGPFNNDKYYLFLNTTKKMKYYG